VAKLINAYDQRHHDNSGGTDEMWWILLAAPLVLLFCGIANGRNGRETQWDDPVPGEE